MSVELLYQDDTYCFESPATVTHIEKDEKGWFCVCDRTIFYPQGGGQPADSGHLHIGEERIAIWDVRFVDGTVRHYGDFASYCTELNTLANQSIDSTKRLINSRLHTAGHLVAQVVEELIPSVSAIKGYHFPDGSYIEFVESPSFAGEINIDIINTNIQSMIGRDLPVTARQISYQELAGLSRPIPDNIPSDKPLRVVQLGQMQPMPCGGTHVRSLAELADVKVVKFKSKKGNLRVSYICCEIDA